MDIQPHSFSTSARLWHPLRQAHWQKIQSNLAFFAIALGLTYITRPYLRRANISPKRWLNSILTCCILLQTVSTTMKPKLTGFSEAIVNFIKIEASQLLDRSSQTHILQHKIRSLFLHLSSVITRNLIEDLKSLSAKLMACGINMP